MNTKENKKLIISIVIIVLIISIVGGSLAYWSWQSSEEEKTLVSVSVQGATLTIEGGNVEKTGMYPTNDCDGAGAMIGEVATATAVNGTATDMEVLLKIRASLSVSQGSLTTENKGKINWALVDTSDGTTCSTTTYKGTLADVTTNTDIDTGIRFTATKNATTTKSYRIYVWLDSSYTHTNSGDTISDPMQNLSISVKFSEASEVSQEIATRPAGLYGTNGEFTSWEELLNNGIVNVTDGVLTTGYDYDYDTEVGGNSSDEALDGILVIDSSVTSIGYGAFGLCSNLIDIEIPDSVITIGDWAFHDTTLTTIEIPDSVITIGEYAFYSSALTSIKIPDSVTSIGYRAFYYCSSLTSVVFGENSRLTSIGEAAFASCESLTSIKIPDSVTSIGFEAFYYCSSLTSVMFGKNSQLREIDGSAFNQCNLATIEIPVSVNKIGSYIFNYNDNLTTINYPGTMAQWNAIDLHDYWNGYPGMNMTNITKVICSDETINLS